MAIAHREERRFQSEEIGVVDTLQLLEGAAYLSFIAGAAFAVWQLHEIRQDRRTQLVLNMMETVSSPDIQEQYRKIMDSEFKDGKEAEEKCGLLALSGTGGYYEGLGYLIRRGLIDREAVFEVMQIAAAWDKMKPWIMSESVRGSDPSVFVHFEHAAELDRAYKAKRKWEGG